MSILQAAYNELAIANSRLRTENSRLRAALQIIDDYYQTGGELMSHVSHIAQDALKPASKAEADLIEQPANEYVRDNAQFGVGA